MRVSIASLGSEYVLGLRATGCTTGDVLAEAYKARHGHYPSRGKYGPQELTRAKRRKSTLPCRQPLHMRERGDVVGGRWRERIIFVRAVPSLHHDVMVKVRNSKSFYV